jgi:hypothetical protein
MRYDIYKGTENDMKESGGELQLEKCNQSYVKEFCKRQNIVYAKFLDGDYINGFWLEEAM